MMETSTFNSKTVVVAVVALVIGSWVLQVLYTAATSPLKSVPGPWYSRFTNLVLKQAVTGGRRIFYIDDMHTKYGSVVRISPNEVAVSDVEGFRQIHAVSSKFRKDIWYEKLTNFPRLSVFTMRDPKEHAQRRKLFARGFSKSYLREHWESAVKDKCKLAVTKIRRDAEAGSADLLKWWTFMATDIVGVLGFGESFGMLELGKKTEYIRVLEAALIGNGVGAELPWIRALGARIPIRVFKEAFDSSNYILSYGSKAVENTKKHGEDSNLMATILSEADKESNNLDDMDIRTESTSLIFAGSGTTANTMTFLCWQVLQRPQLQKELEAEVTGVSEDFTDADLEALPLLNAVIQETLRLYCAVPGSLPRVAPPGGATINGYYIPEGTVCSTQAYTVHRDPIAYERPTEFDPSRYLPGKEQSKAAKTTFCAFGAGAYSCLGIHLANMELRCATTLFFRQLKGARLGPTTNDDMQPVNYFVITPKGHKCDITLKGAEENV